MGMDIGILGAFLAGLLSFLSPCVLPIVPPYLCFIAGISFQQFSGEATGHDVTRRTIISAVSFVAGFSTVFVLLGLAASYLGQIVSEYFDVLARVAGGVIILAGLHFAGVLRINALYRELRINVDGQAAGLAGAYLMGLAFAFGWTPCVGPVLAVILMVAGAEESMLEGGYLLASYALGIGLPFIGAAAFAPRFLRWAAKVKRRMALIEKITGALLVATGLLFIFGAVPEISFWILETFPGLGRIG